MIMVFFCLVLLGTSPWPRFLSGNAKEITVCLVEKYVLYREKKTKRYPNNTNDTTATTANKFNDYTHASEYPEAVLTSVLVLSPR